MVSRRVLFASAGEVWRNVRPALSAAERSWARAQAHSRDKAWRDTKRITVPGGAVPKKAPRLGIGLRRAGHIADMAQTGFGAGGLERARCAACCMVPHRRRGRHAIQAMPCDSRPQVGRRAPPSHPDRSGSSHVTRRRPYRQAPIATRSPGRRMVRSHPRQYGDPCARTGPKRLMRVGPVRRERRSDRRGGSAGSGALFRNTQARCRTRLIVAGKAISGRKFRACQRLVARFGKTLAPNCPRRAVPSGALRLAICQATRCVSPPPMPPPRGRLGPRDRSRRVRHPKAARSHAGHALRRQIAADRCGTEHPMALPPLAMRKRRASAQKFA